MNILAVDDEKIALNALTGAIEEAIKDVKIFSFRTGAEALKCAGETRIDVAFIDIEMREMNGLELAKRLKDIYGTTNIVFVTGYTDYALDALNLYVSGYLLKPVSAEQITKSMENLRVPVEKETASERLKIQCFGNFEVFADNEPIAFSRKKSKELFAYLVDRRGAQVSMAEIASVLWEDGQYSLSRNNQIHTFLHDLVKTLNAHGAKDIIIRHRNALAVEVSKINCDSYECLSGNPAAINSYTGEYMSQYHWAEFSTWRIPGDLR